MTETIKKLSGLLDRLNVTHEILAGKIIQVGTKLTARGNRGWVCEDTAGKDNIFGEVTLGTVTEWLEA